MIINSITIICNFSRTGRESIVFNKAKKIQYVPYSVIFTVGFNYSNTFNCISTCFKKRYISSSW